MKKLIIICVVAGLLLVVVSPVEAMFTKTPLYDQDKDGLHDPDYTCWMASASNMLAAGGYGNVQTIYDRMTAHYKWATGGLQDQALSWYIDPARSWYDPTNPYTIVNSYSGDTHANPDFILQELKRCQYVGIAFWWGSDLGHAITVWGDDESTPRRGYFSDSDREDGGDYTWYKWKDQGSGDWILSDYFGVGDDRIADVDYVATLSPIPAPGAILLGGIGVGLVGWLRRRRAL